MKNLSTNRRHFVQSSVFGILAVSTTTIACSKNMNTPLQTSNNQYNKGNQNQKENKLFYRYPSLDDESVSAVVGAAHSNLEKVKTLVNNRPELANAAWDWGFGDWESALGAAAHMGRKDIAEFLMSHGARPNHFTFAMLGEVAALKAMIAARPGLQRVPGPHGIPLLQHAKHRFWHKDITPEDKKKVEETIAYLETIGDADETTKSLEMTEATKEIYVGNYRFGTGEEEVFEVTLNRRKMLSIARKGTFGRSLHNVSEHRFTVGGAPSVHVTFVIKNGKALSLAVHEPEPLVTAKRIS